MAKKDNTHPILQEIKNTAKDHQAFEKERGKNLIYGHALDIASKKLVKVDWNTACAMAKKGTLSMRGESITKEPIEAMNCQMIYRGFTGTGKTEHVRKYLSSHESKDVQEALKSLFERSKTIDTDNKSIKTFYDVINQNKAEYTPVLIPDNETQSSSDFVAGPKKVFYSKRNPLIGEWENLLSDPNYEEIPYEIESFEEMGLWAKNRNGTLFFPTASVADLKNNNPAIAKSIEANIGTKVLFGRNGSVASFDLSTDHDNSFVIGQSGSGQSFFIKDLICKEKRENPSLTEEEATRIVYEKYQIQTVLDHGESYETIILSAQQNNMSAILQSIPNHELIKLVNMSIPPQNLISRGHRPYNFGIIEKLSMIREEADRRGLEYVITYRDDIGIHEELTNTMLTELRKHGKQTKQKSRSFVRSAQDKHAKTRFSTRNR